MLAGNDGCGEAGTCRVLVFSDHTLLREGLRAILESRPGFAVVGESADRALLSRTVADLGPDLLILGAATAGSEALRAADEVKHVCPGVRVLLLGTRRDKDYLGQVLDAGVNGYLLKESPTEELFVAMDRIRRGETYLSPAVSDALLDVWRGLREGPEKSTLTAREREVLRLIAEGKSSRAIAELLFVSVYTVDRHRANIKAKLKVKKVADLVKHAIATGLVTNSFEQ